MSAREAPFGPVPLLPEADPADAEEDPAEPCFGAGQRLDRLQRSPDASSCRLPLLAVCVAGALAAALVAEQAFWGREAGSLPEPLVVRGGSRGFRPGKHGAAEYFPFTQLTEVPPGACEVPKDWCSEKHYDQREKTLSYRDCDGDDIPDPYCESEERLMFGFIGSASGCKDNWPQGLCMHPDEPPLEEKCGWLSWLVGCKEVQYLGGKPVANNEITLIHFNDVYEVAGVFDGTARRGGFSRAAWFIKEERERNPDRTFVVFAGDVLSPSVLSDLFEGEQMVDMLNYLKLDAASLGNHEFDLGIDILTTRIGESDFPWVNTNLLNASSGEILDGTVDAIIKEFKWAPHFSEEANTHTGRICIFGVAYDVRQTVFRDTDKIGYNDSVAAAKNASEYLKKQKNCTIVVALTHQFTVDDCDLAADLGTNVDIILGGHDHKTELRTACGKAPIVKADSDLKAQWIMSLRLDDDGAVESIDGQLLALSDMDPFDPGMHKKIISWELQGRQEMGKRLGCTDVDLDGRTSIVRSQESDLGNFVADAMRAHAGTDIAIVNGGTLRGDMIFPKGDLTRGSITRIHPFGNKLVSIKATGREIREDLASRFRCIDTLCGAFPQVSGIRVTFDPSKPEGQEITRLTMEDGSPFWDRKEYTLVATDYMLTKAGMIDHELYKMTTLNDAVPMLNALFEVVQKADREGKCITAEVDGRVTQA